MPWWRSTVKGGGADAVASWGATRSAPTGQHEFSLRVVVRRGGARAKFCRFGELC
jgi:hypothetical protein